MDITLLQIQNGKTSELLSLKKEIIGYLYNKKFSTKSITLVKTLKLIDKETIKRKNENICKDESLNFQIIPDTNLKKLEDTPVFICNNQIRISIPDFLQESSNKSSCVPEFSNYLNNVYNCNKSDLDLLGKKRDRENSDYSYVEDKTTYTSSCNKSDSEMTTFLDNFAVTVNSKEKENENSIVANDLYSESGSIIIENNDEFTGSTTNSLKCSNESDDLSQINEDKYFYRSFKNTFKYSDVSDLNLKENNLYQRSHVINEDSCHLKNNNCKITKNEKILDIKSNNDHNFLRPKIPENEVCLQKTSFCTSLNEVNNIQKKDEKEDIIKPLANTKPIQKRMLKARKKLNLESNMVKNEIDLIH